MESKIAQEEALEALAAAECFTNSFASRRDDKGRLIFSDSMP